MMTKLIKILPLILCCAGFPLFAQDTKPVDAPAAQPAPAAAPAAEKMDVYDRIKAQLSALDHRVPGSEEYKKAIEILKAELGKEGIVLHEQTYPTLVPEIHKQEFTIVGKEDQQIKFFPLAPNNAALISTGKNPIVAPVVYISADRLKSNDFGHVDGKIVLLDWGENAYPKIFFPEGAKAIIFVGNDVAKQWDVAKLQSQYNIAFPFFYITREEAQKHGLLDCTPDVDPEKLPKANLVCHTNWKSVEGVNLWAEIKGNGEPTEALTLNARLDTFGTVPGMVRGDRLTHNIALLAQTAVNLSREKKLTRSVFVVFYGSSFNAYDGLRFFYYPVYKRKGDAAPDPKEIADYAKGFREELVDNDIKLEILNSPSPMLREKTEFSKKDYIKIGSLVAGTLLIALGLMIVAVFIKKTLNAREEGQNTAKPAFFKSLSNVLAMLLILSGIVTDVYFGKFYDTSIAAQEKEKLVSASSEIVLKLNGLKDKIGKAKTEAEIKSLEAEYYALLEEYDELQKDLHNGQEPGMYYPVRQLLRTAVIKDYNAKNYRLADINVQIRKNDEKLKELDPASPEAKQLLEEQKKLTAERDELNVTKKDIANMRKLINERKVTTPAERKLLASFADQIKATLERRRAELEVSIKMADCWTEIANATKPYAFIGCYYFDLASAKDPFFFATRTYEALHFTEDMDSSFYKPFFEVFGNKLPGMTLTGGKFFKEALNDRGDVNTLSSLSLVYLPHAASLPLREAFSMTLRNIPGDYDFDEMPGKYDQFDLKDMIPVMTEMFTVLGTDAAFSITANMKACKLYDNLVNYYYKNNEPFGRQFSYLAADGKEIDGPAADAIAIIQQNEYDRILPMAGFSMVALGKINQIGYTTMPLLTGGGRWGKGNIKIHGAAMAFNEYGHVEYINTTSENNKLFRAYGGPHVYSYAPLTSNFAGSLSLVNGFTDGAFKNSRTYARVATGDGYAYADRDMKAKLYFFNETFILGNVNDEHPTGDGISIAPEALLNMNVNSLAINNTIALNLQRLEKLHSRNIFNSVVELYHDKAEQHKQDAEAARKAGNLNRARAHEIFGQTLAVQAYRPLKNLINDLVKSVLILLILTIPFSFALERLLIGATNIYKQMAWILVFFIATFLLLYFTHPAFAMSQAPMIIFIAFFIIVMSVMVIYIVMSRFKSELLAMQGMDTSSHRVNTENSMLLAAIMIGVSSMRNRPVKTFLTILTVILLTFTIISFASFDSTSYVRPVYMGDGSGEHRIESFLPQHVDLLEPLCQSMKELYHENYDVFFRSASYNSPFYMLSTYPMQSNVIYNPDYVPTKEGESQTVVLDAVVGFEPGETLSSEKLGVLMVKMKETAAAEKAKREAAEREGKVYQAPPADPIPGVYLSEARAASLGLKVGSIFYLRTMKVRLDGIFKASDLDSLTYLDNGKAVPPNFKETQNAEAASVWTVLNNAYVDASNFIWSSPDLTLLTDYETARKINGFVNAVIFYPKSDDIDIRKDATDIAEVTFGIVYSNTASNGVERHFMAPVFEASGLSNLFVPLLLGALIILSSLLGSIADREREIFTFSALGLSPKDVSCLFFAESSVYAVIGGLGGYLLSQVTNAVLTALAKRGLLEAPEMNFSSMTTVYTILIVMAIVLLSTVYPAIKAGRAASPDVARKWKMPPPEGDKLCFQFPFTVSRIDFGGILVFIGEHFANHADSSLGSFAASNIRITHGNSELTDGYMLTADFTLAPFDLGVAEEMSMYSAPSDIEGIDVVTVRIIRRDGSKGAWLRGNHRFVDEIRNQFLLWRSLPVETVLHYRELAAKKLNQAADTEGAQA